MSDPRKHHYNPAFYLKHWAQDDGELTEIRKAHGKMEAHPRHPNATGFVRDLYKTEGVSEEHAQHLEKNFMKPLDTQASAAVDKLLAGKGSSMTGNERTAWTMFILSLLFRNPEAVSRIKSHIIINRYKSK